MNDTVADKKRYKDAIVQQLQRHAKVALSRLRDATPSCPWKIETEQEAVGLAMVAGLRISVTKKIPTILSRLSNKPTFELSVDSKFMVRPLSDNTGVAIIVPTITSPTPITDAGRRGIVGQVKVLIVQLNGGVPMVAPQKAPTLPKPKDGTTNEG